MSPLISSHEERFRSRCSSSSSSSSECPLHEASESLIATDDNEKRRSGQGYRLLLRVRCTAASPVSRRRTRGKIGSFVLGFSQDGMRKRRKDSFKKETQRVDVMRNDLQLGVRHSTTRTAFRRSKIRTVGASRVPNVTNKWAQTGSR
jgi:hypothetical protein